MMVSFGLKKTATTEASRRPMRAVEKRGKSNKKHGNNTCQKKAKTTWQNGLQIGVEGSI
jgi:hypothetical protein